MDLLKSFINCLDKDQQARSHVPEVADDVVAILLITEKHGESLKKSLDDAVSSLGWSSWLAENVLKKLETALNEGRDRMGPAMKKAYDDAVEAAEGAFEELVQQARDHPLETAAVVLLSILALGVLVALAPYILELLGFSELGPVEGKRASTDFTTAKRPILTGDFRQFCSLVGGNVRRQYSCRVTLLLFPAFGHGLGLWVKHYTRIPQCS